MVLTWAVAMKCEKFPDALDPRSWDHMYSYCDTAKALGQRQWGSQSKWLMLEMSALWSSYSGNLTYLISNFLHAVATLPRGFRAG